MPTHVSTPRSSDDIILDNIFDPGSNGSSFPVQTEIGIGKSMFGLLIFLGTEVMFFAGLISAFLILRAGSGVWPPFDQPRLPVAVTGINTFFLLISGYTIYRALEAIRRGSQQNLTAWLLATGILGIVFISVQGYEWIRLVSYGLTVSSSIYGATFYTLIGAHALHVLAAMIALLFVFTKSLSQQYSEAKHTGVELCQMYWLFVVGIWPVLYILVYLT